MGFVHLRVHSAYSLLEGALPLKRLIELAAADRMPALGIADTGNLFGALEFAEKMVEKGIQPIIGCQVAVDFADLAEETRPGGPPRGKPLSDLVLIAATEAGYWNLVRLVSDSFMRERGRRPRRTSAFAALGERSRRADRAHRRAGRAGRPGACRRAERACRGAPRPAGRGSSATGSMSSCSATARQAEQAAEPALIDLAYDRGLPLVATNEAFFPTRDDYEAHDALIAIAEGAVIADGNRRRLTPEHYFKIARRDGGAVRRPAGGDREHGRDRAALLVVAAHAQAHPAALRRRRRRPGGGRRAPRRWRCARRPWRGSTQRLAAHGLAPGFSEDDYRERLDYELGVIERMKYPGYFLIVADFIQWAKAQGIPVGPGRGSGAGSVVAWSLTITDLDPLRFDLLFERFLNPDRVSMPDFDIDFCQNRRDEVIHYVQQKYGADQVAQIITFGTLQARAVLRDVGRVLQMPYGQVDRLAKMVPDNPANPVTLAQAIADEPQLQAARDSDETRRPAARDRAEARGALPPRLDPRRRHRHRRPAARPSWCRSIAIRARA